MQLGHDDGPSQAIDEFLVVLAEAQVPSPAGPISGLDWLTSKDPLARQIRCLVLILSNWPTTHAPWAILQPVLRLAKSRVSSDKELVQTRCTRRYPRRKDGRCARMTSYANGRCEMHGGK